MIKITHIITALFVLLGLIKTCVGIDLVGNIDLLTLTSNQGIKIKNAQASRNNDRSLCVGDINGDSFPDLVIGNPQLSPFSRSEAGIVSVIFGTSNGFSDVDLNSFNNNGFRIIGAVGGIANAFWQDTLGDAVACPGDVNGDNIDDIVITGLMRDAVAGNVWVIFGKQVANRADIDLADPLDPSDGIRIYGGLAPFDYFGGSISAADLNQDNKKDLIISATGRERPGSIIDAGCVYVIYAQPGGLSDIDLSSFPTSASQGFKIIGATTGDQIGTSVSYAGDLDGDTFADFVIGAGFAPNATRNGKAYVIYGQAGGFTSIDLASFPNTQSFIVEGVNPGDYLGSSVSYIGDFNGDNFDDIILGAPAMDLSSRADAGASYVIFGKSGRYTSIDLTTFPSSEGFQIMGATAGDGFGTSVTNAGDINQDGFDDLLIGAPQFDQGSNLNAGAAYVIFGHDGTVTNIDTATLSITQGLRITGAATGGLLGRVVSYAGDINGDGYADMFLRASSYSTVGVVYVLYGGPISYLYWDNTYLSECTSPLRRRQDDFELAYCDYPCTNPSDSLYWNGSCLSSCGSPFNLDVFKSKLFCAFPCTNSTDYLYWNGSCLPSMCSSPIIFEDAGGRNLCKRPCSDVSLFYYPEDKSCRLECPSPYLVEEMEYGKTCSATATSGDVQQMQTIADTITIGTSIGQGGLIVVNIAFPTLSAAATSASLARLISYTRYLNISASPRLKILYNNTEVTDGSLPFVSDLPGHPRDTYDYPSVLSMFSRYKISGSFLANCWGALMSIVFTFGALIPFWLVDYITKNRSRETLPWRFFLKLRIIIQNFTLIQIYGSLGDLFLFTLLEIHTQIFGSAEPNLSLGISLICSIIGVGVMIFHFKLLRKYQQIKKIDSDSKQAEAEFRQRYAGVQVLFDDFKDTSFLLQAFLLFLTLRDVLFKVILIFLYPCPFAQITLIVSMSSIFVYFLFKKRPYREVPELLQAVTLEVVFLIVNVSLFEIASLDASRIGYNNIVHFLGDVIVYCSLFCHFVPILFICLKLIYLIRQHWDSCRRISIKAVVDLGMNIPISDQEVPQTTSKQVNRKPYAKLTASPTSAKVSPLSVDMSVPMKPLVTTKNPSKPNEIMVKPQQTPSQRRPDSLTKTSLSSVDQPFKRRPVLRSTIIQGMPSENNPSQKEIKTQSQVQADHRNDNGDFKVDLISLLHLDVPGKRNNISTRRDSIFSMEKPLDVKQDGSLSSSTKHLLSENRKLFSEDEEVQFMMSPNRRTIKDSASRKSIKINKDSIGEEKK